ncbi:MAG: hypothetical protein ACO1SV_08625, partial [Fimbriimonas sp.]
AKHVQLTDEGREVVQRCAKDLSEAAGELFSTAEAPLRDLAAAQRHITTVLTRHYYPRMD